ncbi:uncharacterized protein [Leptinotarsa decemlineata]|uniref:uncharacterized protein n=1 Tax=Leptinotarsa decemlineata TaxID=7539 RepID=UPI003D30491D
MVVFTCNHCGESLQKPKVEKHYAFVCRRPKFLTCVDCFKDYREDEYVVHTKCVTEEERYAAKGSLPNGIVKKGEVKQESWVEMVRSVMNKELNMKPSHRNLLNKILTFTNIPRKKPKFLNFIKSSSGGRVNMKEVEEVWDIIEKYKNEQSANKSENNTKNGSESNATINKTDELKKSSSKAPSDNTELVEVEKQNSKAKRKNLDEDVTVSKKKIKLEENSIIEETQTENEKFSFQDEIIRIVTSKGRISYKKLEKKIINAYLKHSGKTEVTPKVIKKFSKNLRKISNIEVQDDYVSLTC